MNESRAFALLCWLLVGWCALKVYLYERRRHGKTRTRRQFPSGVETRTNPKPKVNRIP